MKKILLILIIILIGIFIYIWLFTSFSFGGSKNCSQDLDCKKISGGILSGCWSRKPIKIGGIDILYLPQPFACYCDNNQCQQIELLED
ncbi:MAG: hypothetical protein WCS88_03645 [Patescibacteria group bacterium]|jgi:hypothetical protein